MLTAWLEVRATGPDYPIAKATQANPQVSTEGVVQLDGICCLGAPIDRVGITRGLRMRTQVFRLCEGAQMICLRQGRVSD